MTLVEISGITSLEDARHAIDAGSHALHFNFPAHPRAGADALDFDVPAHSPASADALDFDVADHSPAGTDALDFDFPAHPRDGTFLIGDPAAATKALTRP